MTCDLSLFAESASLILFYPESLAIFSLSRSS
jgi:hypothetical protein